VITQEHFKNNIEFFSGLDLSEAFNTYVWGENEAPDSDSEESEAHRPLTEAQLLEIL
jgi:hypothetical protein